jgi:hypothetical protein
VHRCPKQPAHRRSAKCHAAITPFVVAINGATPPPFLGPRLKYCSPEAHSRTKPSNPPSTARKHGASIARRSCACGSMACLHLSPPQWGCTPTQRRKRSAALGLGVPARKTASIWKSAEEIALKTGRDAAFFGAPSATCGTGYFKAEEEDVYLRRLDLLTDAERNATPTRRRKP